MISAIVVVSDHSFDYIGYVDLEKCLPESILYYIVVMMSKGLTSLVMPLFFFLSALLLYKDWDGSNIIYKYKMKLVGRCKSVAVPYILWNVIWMVFSIILGNVITSTNIDASITFDNIFLGVLGAKYNEVFWFMKVLIIYIVLYPIVGLLIQRFGKYSSILLAFFWSVICAFQIFKIIVAFFWWVVGACVSIHGIKGYEKVKIPHLLFVVCTVFVLLLMALEINNVLYVLKNLRPELCVWITLPFSVIGVGSLWILFDRCLCVDIPESITRASFLIYGYCQISFAKT